MTQEELHERYGTAEDWYSTNESVRNTLETDWKDSAQLTLPYVFPDDGQDQTAIMPTPYNSIGPSAVNALAAKLLLALLPPTGVFFRLIPDKEVIDSRDKEGIKQLDLELSQVEKDVIEYINQKALRVPTFEAIKLLIVTGNAMIYKVPNGGIKVFSPYQYTVQRDYIGNVLTSCIKETMALSTLPRTVQEQLRTDTEDTVTTVDNSKAVKQVNVYTMIVRTAENKYVTWQEINQIVIEGTIKEYTKEKLPYIVLRWTTVNNEDYGRGLVQQYLGDLRSLEGLTQTIVEGAGVSAMHLFGLRAGSTLQVEDLNNAQNGEFVLGDLEKEVSVLQVNKGADLQVPLQLMAQLEQRISKAFLNVSGQIRDSERTTATEVRATAAELEATLGGVFSVLANEFQTPIINLILQDLTPEVLKIAIPSVTTGISAISRERDYTNLNTMLQSIAQLGPEVVAQYLDVPAYLAQVAASLGMNPQEIVKSPDKIQQEQQMAMQQQAQMQQQEQAGKLELEQQKQGGNNGS